MPIATADVRHAAPGMVDPVRVRWRLFLRGPGHSHRVLALAADAAFLAGGLLILWSAYIHFHLWDETNGYRSIPTIGWMFLLQSLAGLVLGIGVAVVRRVWAALLGIGFALATIAGFLISVSRGLFGFEDSWLAPYATQAFAIEVAGAAVLCVAAVLSLVGSAPDVRTGSSPAGRGT